MKQLLTRVLLIVFWSWVQPFSADAVVQSQALNASTIVQYSIGIQVIYCGIFRQSPKNGNCSLAVPELLHHPGDLH